jgi:N-methylhydantoinase B
MAQLDTTIARPEQAQDFYMTAADVKDAYGVDLVTAETVRNGLIEVTRQMYASLIRSAFSNIVRDSMDFGVCVHKIDPDGTTDLVAITEGCTQFAFTHQHMTNMVLDEYGLENLGPGDTLVCNDAFRGGIHFGDLNFFRVLFDDKGEPAFVLTNAAHVFDIGGPVAGGFNNGARNIYEEGLRISPTLIMSGGKPVRSMMNLLMENTRSPLYMIGDVRALLGTLKTGEERVQELVDRYGFDGVRGGSDYTLGLSERRMRRALSTVPDGDYESSRLLDDDGVEFTPLQIAVTIKVRGVEAEIDFSGTDRQSAGPITTCWEEASRAIVGPKLVLDPRHPMNAGAMRPFHVLLPPGSLVLGLPPTSQSNHCEIATKVGSITVEAMSKAKPEAGVASDSGTSGSCIIYGSDSRSGREGEPFGMAFLMGEAWGGTPNNDGISFCMTPLFNCRSVVIEFAEKGAPLIFWEDGIVMDSAGAGKHRAGYSPVGTVEAYGPAFLSPLLDGARFSADGVNGGGSGSTSYGMLLKRDKRGGHQSWNGIVPADRYEPLYGIFTEAGIPDPDNGEFGQGARFETAKLAAFPIEAGQIYRQQVASAAGYGDPLDRDPAAVRLDVWNELVSPGHARDVYGVVIDTETLEVDAAATEQRRDELRSGRDGGAVDTPRAYFRDWPATESEWDELFLAPVLGAATAKES